MDFHTFQKMLLPNIYFLKEKKSSLNLFQGFWVSETIGKPLVDFLHVPRPASTWSTSPLCFGRPVEFTDLG